MMKGVVAAVALLVLTMIGDVLAKPNVLFIAVDDLNDWVGCLGGNPDTQTPNIDRLARRGLVFVNAACAAPSCVPSRIALMTGKSPADTGLYDNPNGEFRRYADLKNLVTLPQYFSQQGYHTLGVGKLLHNPNKADYDELNNIVYWRNPEPAGVDCTKPPRTKEEYLEWWKPVDVNVEEMTDWKMAHWAAQQLERKFDKPFFLACGIFRPHEPWNVPRKYYEKFPLDQLTLPKVKKDDMEDLGPGQRQPNPTVIKIVDDEQTWRKGVQAYLASVNFADECVGMLLDALDRSPYKDNTIIILWSDHGWHLGEKLHWSKFTLWEESARCVLLCAGPGVAAGTRCNQPVSLLDIYPTLVEMCALPAKAGLAGESFLPQLKDPACKRTKPSVTANTKGFSVRTEQWRYISYYDGSEELYDHDKDPLEWDNLAGKAELAGTKETLKVFVPKKPHPARKPDTEPKAQTKKVSQIDINPAKTQK
jgi:arylsulfatase A-like enzyme